MKFTVMMYEGTFKMNQHYRAEIFNTLTRLQGAYVYLEPVTESLADQIFTATEESKKELYRFMPFSNETVEDVKKFCRSVQEHRLKGEELHLAIFDSDTDTFAGVIGVFHFRYFTPSAEIGYWIRSSVAGKGFATDAVKALLTFLRDTLSIVRVDAEVAEDNIGSRRVMEKCGFQKEGFKPKSHLCHGEWQNMVLYGILLE